MMELIDDYVVVEIGSRFAGPILTVEGLDGEKEVFELVGTV